MILLSVINQSNSVWLVSGHFLYSQTESGTFQSECLKLAHSNKSMYNYKDEAFPVVIYAGNAWTQVLTGY